MSESFLKATRHAVAIAGAILVSAMITTLIGYNYLAHEVEMQNAYEGSKTIKDIEYAASQVTSVASQIRKRTHIDCSLQSRRILRGFVFESYSLADIGLYGDSGVACTAMSGLLDNEAADPPDGVKIGEGRYVWPSRDIVPGDGLDSAIAYRTLDLLFLIEPLNIYKFPVPGASFEIVVKNEEGVSSVGGREGLHNAFSESNRTLSGVAATECSERFGYCITIQHTWSYILANNVGGVFGLIVIFALMSFTIGSVARKHLRHRVSSKARTLSAMSKRSFHVDYQPIVDLRSARIIGCEALARLEDRYGFLSPAEFVPIIASANMRQMFIEMMFDKAYSGLRRMEWHGKEQFKLSFNLFPENLNMKTSDFFAGHEALDDGRFKICVEVTEDSNVSDSQYKSMTEHFSKLGMEVSVDDFGTGYSNLNRVQFASITNLKIDKSLISHITPENVEDSMAFIIPTIAKRSGLTIIAEGIETLQNLEAVRGLGVGLGQGFYMSRPVPGDVICDLASRNALLFKANGKLAVA